MMYSYPFFSFPHFRKYAGYTTMPPAYLRQPSSKVSKHSLDYGNYAGNNSTLNRQSTKEERNSSKKLPSGFSFLNNTLHQEDRNDDKRFFEFFGLKLYDDDILLLGLIFFLYKEDVKDQYLFIALILLLLS